MDYYTHYTFNDNSIVDAIDAMLEAARIYKEPRYLASAEKGGEFMLLAQMPEPQPGWAQQYDRDMAVVAFAILALQAPGLPPLRAGHRRRSC